MNLQVSPQDINKALLGVGAIQNPVGTVVSLLGISPEEQRAGIPAWAWAMVAFGVGTYFGVKYGHRLRF